jgi:hypothetical protein
VGSRGSQRLTRGERERLEFLFGFGRWLHLQGYKVGMTPEAIPPSESVGFVKALAPLVGSIMHLGPVAPALAELVEGGASRDAVAFRLEPLREVVDFFGLRSAGSEVNAAVVIFADDLPVERLVARFEMLTEFSEHLKDLAPIKVPLVWTPSVTVEVIYVFFDTAQCDSKLEVLEDARVDASGRTVRAGCLDLESQVFHSAAARGFWSVREAFETDDMWFGAEDMAQVLEFSRAGRRAPGRPEGRA